MSEFSTVMAASGAILAVYFPLAFWIGRDYVPTPVPNGAKVELVLKIDHISGFAYTAQSLVLASYADQTLSEQHSPVAVYENLQPLGPGHSTAAQVANVGRGHFNHAAGPPDRPPSWRFITFSSSDNSDPRKNGRRYYIVLPRSAE